MNKRSVVIALCALCIVAVIAVSLAIRHKPASKKEIRISGVVEVTTTELSFKLPGRLIKRFVDEGMTVTAGQEVALLEDTELQQERASRLADEKTSRAALSDLEAGSRREEIAQAEAQLSRVKADAVKFARDAERAEGLYKREVLPKKELEFATAARETSAAAVREAEQRLKLLLAGPRPLAVRQAQARVEAAAAGVALADTRLSHTVLHSPVAGVVLSKHVEAGEMVAAGAPVVTIGNMDDAWIRGYIPEAELGRVKIGQSAQVSFDTWPGRNFDGRISFISSEAEFTPKNVQTEKERVKLVYRIKISLPNPKGELKPGMPADAVILTTP